jgi:hypothetical protein
MSVDFNWIVLVPDLKGFVAVLLKKVEVQREAVAQKDQTKIEIRAILLSNISFDIATFASITFSL